MLQRSTEPPLAEPRRRRRRIKSKASSSQPLPGKWASRLTALSLKPSSYRELTPQQVAVVEGRVSEADESTSKSATLRQNCSILADSLRFHRAQANATFWHQKSPVDKILFYVDYRRKPQHGKRLLKLSLSFRVLAKRYRRHVLMGWIVGSPATRNG